MLTVLVLVIPLSQARKEPGTLTEEGDIFQVRAQRWEGKMGLKLTSPAVMGYLAHNTLLAVCAREDKGKACPLSPMPISGLGLLLPICLDEGSHFLVTWVGSRIKKYFLFKYEGGKLTLKN